MRLTVKMRLPAFTPPTRCDADMIAADAFVILLKICPGRFCRGRSGRHKRYELPVRFSARIMAPRVKKETDLSTKLL